MTRALDLRTDVEMREDWELVRWWRRPCRLYPGCDCDQHHKTEQCAQRLGVFYDDE